MRSAPTAASIHPEDVDDVARIVADGIKNKQSYEIEYRVVHKDGARALRVRTRAGASSTRRARRSIATASSSNVHERRNIEAELRESETRFRTLCSNVPGACYRCAYDIAYSHGVHQRRHRGHLRYPSATSSATSARTYASIIHPDDLGDGQPTRRRSPHRRTQSSIEYRIVHRDGTVRWSMSGPGIYDADDKILHIDGAIFDITARKAPGRAGGRPEADGDHRQVAATVSTSCAIPLGAISNSMAFLRQMTANRQLGIEKRSTASTTSERMQHHHLRPAEYTSQKELSRAATRSRPG